MSKTCNKYICNICHYVSSNKQHYNKHLTTLKHTNKSDCSSLAINGNQKNEENNFQCKYHSNYDKYLLSEKTCVILNETREKLTKQSNKAFSQRNIR